MGKVKNFFRKKQMPKQVQEQVQKEIQKAKRNERARRYCLMVEDVVESSRMQGIMVIGNIHGRVRVGDTMYLYQPDRPVKEVSVLSMELGPRDVVETAKDCQIGLCLNLEDVEEVSRFAVLSSIKPLGGMAAERVIENARLFGLMMEYERWYTNSVYMDALLYELCYAKFILPLYMDRPPMPQEDGTLAFGSDAQVGFRSLRKADEENSMVFPAFTDEVAAMAWKDAFSEGQPKRFATMRLPHLIEYVRQGHAGLTINPFGPVPVYFPKELLDTVEQSDVYKKRYSRPVGGEKEQATEE